MLKHFKLVEVSGGNEASPRVRVILRMAWALAVSWCSLLSTNIFAVYLILNDRECLDSLSGIFFKN